MAHTAISINDDFPARQTGISSRAAKHKGARRVHQEPVIIMPDCAAPARGQRTVKYRLDNIPDKLAAQPFLGGLRIMLGRNHYGIDPLRHTASIIFHRYLRFTVRPQMRNDPLFAHICQLFRQPVRKFDRQRHKSVSLITGIPEHDPLVAGPLHGIAFLLRCGLPGYACIDLRALLVDRYKDPCRTRIQPDVRTGIPYTLQCLAHYLIDIDIPF